MGPRFQDRFDHWIYHNVLLTLFRLTELPGCIFRHINGLFLLIGYICFMKGVWDDEEELTREECYGNSLWQGMMHDLKVVLSWLAHLMSYAVSVLAWVVSWAVVALPLLVVFPMYYLIKIFRDRKVTRILNLLVYILVASRLELNNLSTLITLASMVNEGFVVCYFFSMYGVYFQSKLVKESKCLSRVEGYLKLTLKEGRLHSESSEREHPFPAGHPCWYKIYRGVALTLEPATLWRTVELVYYNMDQVMLDEINDNVVDLVVPTFEDEIYEKMFNTNKLYNRRLHVDLMALIQVVGTNNFNNAAFREVAKNHGLSVNNVKRKHVKLLNYVGRLNARILGFFKNNIKEITLEVNPLKNANSISSGRTRSAAERSEGNAVVRTVTWDTILHCTVQERPPHPEELTINLTAPNPRRSNRPQRSVYASAANKYECTSHKRGLSGQRRELGKKQLQKVVSSVQKKSWAKVVKDANRKISNYNQPTPEEVDSFLTDYIRSKTFQTVSKCSRRRRQISHYIKLTRKVDEIKSNMEKENVVKGLLTKCLRVNFSGGLRRYVMCSDLLTADEVKCLRTSLFNKLARHSVEDIRRVKTIQYSLYDAVKAGIDNYYVNPDVINRPGFDRALKYCKHWNRESVEEILSKLRDRNGPQDKAYIDKMLSLIDGN